MSIASFYIDNGIDPYDQDSMDAYLGGVEEGHEYGAWAYKWALEADEQDSEEGEDWLSDLEDDYESDLDTKIAGGVTVKTQKESRAPIWKYFISKDNRTALCRTCDGYKEVSRANCNYNGQRQLGNIKMKMHLKSEHLELYVELITIEGEYFKNEKGLWSHVGEVKKACNEERKTNGLLVFFKKNAIEQAKKVLSDKVRNLKADGKIMTEEDAKILKKEFDGMVEVFPMWGEERLSEMYSQLDGESRQEFRVFLHRRKVGPEANCLFQRAAVTGESLEGLEPTVIIGHTIAGNKEMTEMFRCSGCAQAVLGEMIDWEGEGFGKFRLDKSHQPTQIPLISQGKKIETTDLKGIHVRNDLSTAPAQIREVKDDFKNNFNLPLEGQWEASLELFKLNKELWKEVNEVRKKLNLAKEGNETLLVQLQLEAFHGGEDFLVNLLKEKKKNGKAINVPQTMKTFHEGIESMAQDDLEDVKDIYKNFDESTKKAFHNKFGIKKGDKINWEMLVKEKYDFLMENHDKENEDVDNEHFQFMVQCMKGGEEGKREYIRYCLQNGLKVGSLKMGARAVERKLMKSKRSSNDMDKSKETPKEDLGMASLSIQDDKDGVEVSHGCQHPGVMPMWKRDRPEEFNNTNKKAVGEKGKSKPEYDSQLGKVGIEQALEVLREREAKKADKREFIKKLGTTNVVNFSIVTKNAKLGEYGSIQEPILDVNLSNVKKDLKRMLNVDDIVIAKRHKTISLVFDYPLEKEVVFDLESPDGGGFTRGQLVSAIANKYKQIYKEEEETSSLPVESMSERSTRVGFTGPGSGNINRAQTNGKYGIWGHDLEDLALSDVVFCPKKKRYYLFIES